MRLVGEHGAAVGDRPAGDPLAVRDRARHHLLGPRAAREHGDELAPLLVGLVDVQVLVRDEIAERVGDAVEQRLRALLGEHLVEDGCEAPVGLDERLRARMGAPPGLGLGRRAQR